MNPVETVLSRGSRGLVKLAVGIYFSRIEKFHAERAPLTGPVIFAANHPCSLADAFVVGTSLPRTVCIVATAQLFRVKPLAWLLRQCGVIPVNRLKDDPRAMKSVFDTFEACYRVLEPGGAVIIFPEGVTHDDPQLKAIKSGASRMALELEHRHGGKLGLVVVPVGLTFARKEAYRSEVLVNFGEPIPASEFIAGYEERRKECINNLTTLIGQRMQSLILHLPQLENARLVDAVKRLYLDRLRVGNRTLGEPLTPQAEELVLTQAIAAAIERTRREQPERVAGFIRKLDRYERALRRLQISDETVELISRSSRGCEDHAKPGARPLTPSLSPSEGERVPEGRVRGQQGPSRGSLAAVSSNRSESGVVRGVFLRAAGLCVLAVLGAPIALYGWIHRFVPLLGVHWAREHKTQPQYRKTQAATTAIIAGAVCFAVFYALCIGIVHRFFGWPVSLWYGLSLPVTGLIAHYYTRELRRLGAAVRAGVVLLRAPFAGARLLKMRQELIAEIDAQRNSNQEIAAL